MTPWEGVRYTVYRRIGSMKPFITEADLDEQTQDFVVRQIASGSWEDIVWIEGRECVPGSQGPVAGGIWWDASEEIARAVWARMLPLYDAVVNPWVPAFVLQHVPGIEDEIAGIDAEMEAEVQEKHALLGSGWR